MEERDTIICLKKIKKDLKNTKKILVIKKKIDTEIIFFSYSRKMEEKVLILDHQRINKNAFHENENPFNIDKIEIKRIVFQRTSYGNKG